jgi:hypothetical protein
VSTLETEFSYFFLLSYRSRSLTVLAFLLGSFMVFYLKNFLLLRSVSVIAGELNEV